MIGVKQIILISAIFLTGCSTTNGKNISCDFVVGSYESENDRREKERNNGQSHKKNNEDTVNGILSVISGAIGRAVSGSSKDECT
ncbi:hypothetical protein BEL05_08630 [Shewanella colwelliana]|uniref:Lipoprotein n=1 Tax=Shewanella colwelliana TaxID=23 RepID=A0A1E5ISD3_SHECO|nr:hypothetical protein [Shewanella colwelliana]OEG73469.1 hypothetical protein BEL05_08630 [Shewanella colwelliana]